MSNWKRAASLSECETGCSLETVVEDRIVALFRVGEEEVYAMDGVCPHQGGPVGKGQLHGCVVTCPWHGWQYDVRTGQHQTTPNLRHPTFPVRIQNDEIWVDLEPTEISDSDT